MEQTSFMPLNLQYFAEEGSAEGAQGQPASATGQGVPPATPPGAQGTPANQSSEPAGQTTPPDLNQMLAGDKTLQSQFDQLVGKALTTARGKWEQQQNMTAEQLAAEKEQERADALTAREQALVSRELRADAMGELVGRSLPTELIGCIQTTDAQTMKASLDAAEKAFRAAVQAGIDTRMAGGAPKGNGGSSNTSLDTMRAAAGLKPKA